MAQKVHTLARMKLQNPVEVWSHSRSSCVFTLLHLFVDAGEAALRLH